MTKDVVDGDPYLLFPRISELPATWENGLQYDAGKLLVSYASDEERMEVYLQAMVDGTFKSNFTDIYQRAKEYRRMSFNDPQFSVQKSAVEEDQKRLRDFYLQRDEVYTALVPGTRYYWKSGAETAITFSILMEYPLRRYTSDIPTNETWLRQLNVYLGKVLEERSIPDTGPSKEALAALKSAKEIRARYDALPNHNDPLVVDPVYNDAKALYLAIMRGKAYDPAVYEASSRDTCDQAIGLLDVILKENYRPPEPRTDETALEDEDFPPLEKQIVKLIHFNNLTDTTSGLQQTTRDFKTHALDNSGLIISFIINAFLTGFAPALTAAGTSYAYKTYYKAKGTGPAADLLSKTIMKKAAADQRFINDIRTGKWAFSTADYIAYLILQARLAGKLSVVGTLAGYGGAKIIDESWDAIVAIPGLGWLLDALGADAKKAFCDVSTSDYVSGFL